MPRGSYRCVQMSGSDESDLRQTLCSPLPTTAEPNSPSLWTDWDRWVRAGFALPWRLCGRCWSPRGRGSGCRRSTPPPSRAASQQPCQLGTAEKSVRTERRGLSSIARPRLTSDGERAVVSSVYDQAVHVNGDGRGLGVSGAVPRTGILEQNTDRFFFFFAPGTLNIRCKGKSPITPRFKSFNGVMDACSTGRQ